SVELTYSVLQLGVKEPKEWYNVTHERVIHFGGGGLLTKYGNLFEPLTMAYPTVEWDSTVFEEKSRQDILRWVKLSVMELFPTSKVEENVRIQGVKYSGAPSLLPPLDSSHVFTHRNAVPSRSAASAAEDRLHLARRGPLPRRERGRRRVTRDPP